MSLEGASVSLAASIVSLAFSSLVFTQWYRKRKPFQFAWAVGLGLYAVAAATQFFAEAYGWSVGLYKVYYLTAALLVAVLGIGSVLLVHRLGGYVFAAYTAAVFVTFAAVMAGAAVDTTAFLSPIPVAGAALPGGVRAFSPFLTIPGSLALIGIAAYSWWRTRHVCNAKIAVGAAVVAAGGLLARLDVPWALYLGELGGIALMYWGFLESQELARASARVAAPSP